jgi:4-hydroxy-3-polyprenylbenzoate decarboxylase
MFAPGRHAYKFEHFLNSPQAFAPPHARERPVEVQGLLGGHECGKTVVLGQVADTPQGLFVPDRHAEHRARDPRSVDNTHQDLDDCGLAGPVWTKQAENLALVDLHRYAAERADLFAECFLDVLDINDWGHVRPDCISDYPLPMASPKRTLASFVRELELQGELIRVTETVSPLLDIAARSVAESAQAAPTRSETAHQFDPDMAPLGGRAILFENVQGCDFPLAINLFGSYHRIEHALRCLDGGLDSLADRISALTKMEPPSGAMDLIVKGRQLLPLLKVPPKTVRRGVCQDVVRRTADNEVDLRRLPLLKCWPLDGDPAAVGWPMTAEQAGTAGGDGRYITLAGMHTIHARDRGKAKPSSHNIGMYRAQLLGPTTLAMHWHIHHDGAAHWRSWKEIGEPMPIAICFGGEPVLTYAATAPLPPGVSELLMAGFLEGRGIEMVPAKTVPLRVPANSEIVIEGFVRTDAGACGWDARGDEPLGPGAVLEGPFGDHTGYYSLPDRYPITEVTAITHRTDAIFPATVVGPPPQEDFFLGKATERIFLPLLQTLIPDLVDYNLPMAGCFHNWAVLGIRKAYPLQARRIMHAVWGAGQMSWTKCVLVVDAEKVDVHDQDAVLRAMFTHVDFARDVELTRGPLDILDHAAARRGAGGKIGFDATPRWSGEEGTSDSCAEPPVVDRHEAVQCFSASDVPQWGRGRCVVVSSADDVSSIHDTLEGWNGLALVLDGDVDLRNRLHVWFHVFAGSDPARDVSVRDDVMVLDARTKRASSRAGQHVRDWPPFLGWTADSV